MSTDLTRRGLLIGGVVVAAGGAAWLVRGRRRERTQKAVLAVAAEVDLLPGAPELGRAYLDMNGEEADIDRLCDLLFEGHELDAESVGSRLVERIGRDWIELEMVQVDGWWLSRTEGRFLALVALLSQQVPPER